MTTIPRWKIGLTALLFAGALSFVAPPSQSPESQPGSAESPPAQPSEAEPLALASDPVPELHPTGMAIPVGVEVTSVEERGRWKVTVRHPGRLVALRAANAISAGRDWASVELGPGAGSNRAGAAPPTMMWESTEAGSLETVRAVLRIDDEGKPTQEMVSAPIAVAEHRGRAHLCRSHDDAHAGFSVVCRIGAEAGRVRAANLLGNEPLEHAWVIPMGPSAKDVDLVRLELPRVHGARAAAVSYLLGARAVLVRAEASRLPEEREPSLFLDHSERIQPLPWF